MGKNAYHCRGAATFRQQKPGGLHEDVAPFLLHAFRTFVVFRGARAVNHRRRENYVTNLCLAGLPI